MGSIFTKAVWHGCDPKDAKIIAKMLRRVAPSAYITIRRGRTVYVRQVGEYSKVSRLIEFCRYYAKVMKE